MSDVINCPIQREQQEVQRQCMNEEKSKIKMYSTTASVLLTLESMYSNANPAEYKTRLD